MSPSPTMMDAEFMKWIATLGVGGILAGFMFIFYRKDIKQYTELWKQTSAEMIEVIKENTESNTRLVTLLETKFKSSADAQDMGLSQLVKGLMDRIDKLERSDRGQSSQTGSAGRK